MKGHCVHCERVVSNLTKQGLCRICHRAIVSKIHNFMEAEKNNVLLRPGLKRQIAELAFKSSCDPNVYIKEILEAWLLEHRDF